MEANSLKSWPYLGQTWPPMMWGSVFWRVLECVMLNVERRGDTPCPVLCDFWKLLPRVLPCAVCCKNCQTKVLAQGECTDSASFCRKPFQTVVRFRAAVARSNGSAPPPVAIPLDKATEIAIAAGAITCSAQDFALLGFYVSQCEDLVTAAKFLNLLVQLLDAPLRAPLEKAAASLARNPSPQRADVGSLFIRLLPPSERANFVSRFVVGLPRGHRLYKSLMP